MKNCPTCGRPVRFWRVWQSGTIYRCPACGQDSRISLLSQLLSALLVIPPTLVLGVVLLATMRVQSRYGQMLVIAPMGFGASLMVKYLLARLGRFEAQARHP